MNDLPLGQPLPGSPTPRYIRQEGERNCVSACLVGALAHFRTPQTSQSSISEALEQAHILNETGMRPLCAEDLNVGLHPLGIHAGEVYPLAGLDDQSVTGIVDRFTKLDTQLDHSPVLVMYPRERDGHVFLHYSLLVRIGAKDYIMDPSEIDGGVRELTSSDLHSIVTPQYLQPIMAWSLDSCEPGPYRNEQGREIATLEVPGLDLLEHPLSHPDDLGKAVPTGTLYPTSAAMPSVRNVELYEGYGLSALSRHGARPTGYPRFVIDPWVQELSAQIMGGLDWLPYTNERDARLVIDIAAKQGDALLPDVVVERGGLYWVHMSTPCAKQAWQHAGFGLSARQAHATLEGRGELDRSRRDIAEREIKERISSMTRTHPDDIYLFSTGMASITVANAIVAQLFPDAPSAQFGFPYTDTFMVQKVLGNNLDVRRNVIDVRTSSYDTLAEALSTSQLRAIMLEMPGNPLLTVPHLDRIAEMAAGRVPLVLDPTLMTMFNLDSSKIPFVDMKCTSLTKFFSPYGDVMGGCLELQRDSVFYEQLKPLLDAYYQDTLWHEDAEALAHNSRDFATFMPTINANGRALAEWLHSEYAGPTGPLESVFYPTLTDKAAYDTFMKVGAGYGGLFSFVPRDPAFAHALHDTLDITKGPSLGAHFTLLCMYTLLAHSHELDSVGRLGVPPQLLRASAGREPFDVLQGRFAEGFDRAAFAVKS